MNQTSAYLKNLLIVKTLSVMGDEGSEQIERYSEFTR